MLLIGALNFLPALALGPIVEHFLTLRETFLSRKLGHFMTHKAPSLFDWIVGPAVGVSFRKLDPRLMVKNPVMFVTLVGAVLTTVGIFTAATDRGFIAQLALWLWFTVLFANFAEAVAEGRGKAQAESLSKARKERWRGVEDGREERVPAPICRRATWLSAKRVMLSPPMARLSKASPASTNPPSPANRRRSSARAAATGVRSPAARGSLATASSFASPRRKATRSSTG